jgi:hypothetical protein
MGYSQKGLGWRELGDSATFRIAFNRVEPGDLPQPSLQRARRNVVDQEFIAALISNNLRIELGSSDVGGMDFIGSNAVYAPN